MKELFNDKFREDGIERNDAIVKHEVFMAHLWSLLKKRESDKGFLTFGVLFVFLYKLLIGNS